MDTLPPFQAWTQAWQGAAPPAAWPMSVARTVWVDLPVEVASRLQRFAAAQAQDQMRVFSEMSAQDGAGPANPLMRQATFLQQSSLAWGTEMLEIMELCQEKLLNTGRAPSEAPIHYPKAAA